MFFMKKKKSPKSHDKKILNMKLTIWKQRKNRLYLVLMVGVYIYPKILFSSSLLTRHLWPFCLFLFSVPSFSGNLGTTEYPKNRVLFYIVRIPIILDSTSLANLLFPRNILLFKWKIYIVSLPTLATDADAESTV